MIHSRCVLPIADGSDARTSALGIGGVTGCASGRQSNDVLQDTPVTGVASDCRTLTTASNEPSSHRRDVGCSLVTLLRKVR